MRALVHEKCKVCHSGAPQASQQEIRDLGNQVPDWQILKRDGILRLERIFRFKDFSEALAFAVEIGHLAESENHHPAILIEWGRLTVSWWTHAIGGLHRNDFIMAAKTDRAYSGTGSTTKNKE